MSTFLNQSPVFGPVTSRRFGVSLGVNLMPSTGKICTFDCIYCENGFNSQRRTRDGYASLEDVTSGLRASLELYENSIIYKAREFIDGEGRQKFQEEMTAELVRVLGEKHILVRNAIVRHVEVPEEILAPIQSAAVAKEQDLTNKTQQDTEKRRAERNTEIAKVDQLKREVEQETAKLVATVAAEMKKDVAEINAETKLKAAEIDLECAKIQAKITETRGSAEVKAKFLVENEEALGIKRRASAFKDPSLWADLVFADALNPAVNIRVIHSGEGTLWTDLKGASLAVPAQGKK